MRTAIRRTLKLTRTALLVLAILIVFSVAPTGAWFFMKGWPDSWRTADWSATGTAPDPRLHDEAIVQIYAARAGRWKSIFAVHTWIALKPRGAARFTRYDVVGWGTPLRRDAYPVDGRWYGNAPNVLLDIRGFEAEPIIDKIEAAIAVYPHAARGDYTVWPGPNSNTFVAWVARKVPELALELPPTAIGKDYLGDGPVVAPTPSGSGWQITWSGLAGMALGWREGLEFQFLGTTIGIDPEDIAIKLPAAGTLGIGSLWATLAGAADAAPREPAVSELRRGESVAIGEIAAVPSALEPSHPLR